MQIFLLPRDIRLIFDPPSLLLSIPGEFHPRGYFSPSSRPASCATQRRVFVLRPASFFAPFLLYLRYHPPPSLPFPRRKFEKEFTLAHGPREVYKVFEKKKNKIYTRDSCDICNLNFHFHRKNKKIARGKLLIDELVN